MAGRAAGRRDVRRAGDRAPVDRPDAKRVSVFPTGRVFVNVQKWGDDVPATLADIVDAPTAQLRAAVAAGPVLPRP